METKRQLKVMVVDDQNSACRLIEQLVSKMMPEAAVTTFDDAQDAMTWAQAQVPHLCIIDYRMPYLDGEQFVKKLRTHEAAGPRSTVVMVTALNDESVVSNAKSAGADHVVFKPVDPDQFSAILQAVTDQFDADPYPRQAATG